MACELDIHAGVLEAYSGTDSCVVVPWGVTRIQQRAFEGCTTLEHIELPASVSVIDKVAFGGCTALKEVVFASGEGETTEEKGGEEETTKGETTEEKATEEKAIGLREIAYGAFRNCTALATFNFPESLEHIGSWAFSKCSGLCSITLPSKLKRVDRDAFYGCSSLRYVRLPETLEALSDHIFYGCSALEELHIPAGVNAVGSNVFTSCLHIHELWLEGGFIPQGFFAPANLDVLVVPGMPFSAAVPPQLQLPFAAGCVKLAAAEGEKSALSPECEQFVTEHFDEILQAVRYEAPHTKWLIQKGFVLQQKAASLATRAADFGQAEAAALLLEFAQQSAAPESFSAFDLGFDLEL